MDVDTLFRNIWPDEGAHVETKVTMCQKHMPYKVTWKFRQTVWCVRGELVTQITLHYHLHEKAYYGRAFS